LSENRLDFSAQFGPLDSPLGALNVDHCPNGSTLFGAEVEVLDESTHTGLAALSALLQPQLQSPESRNLLFLQHGLDVQHQGLTFGTDLLAQ
jgi:hypothetical protein